MSARRGTFGFVALVAPLALAALACSRDRGADAPSSGDVALVVPSIDAAPPTIRPPQRTDYLEVPSALPPTGSASTTSDDLAGIDTEECRAFLISIRSCFPESSYREIVKNIRRAHEDPSAHDAVREVCKRMTDSFSQSGTCGQ